MKTCFALALVAFLCAPGTVAAQDDVVPAAAKGDPVSEWVDLLVARLGEKNDVVMRSVDQALVAVGRPAVPALKKVAAGKDKGVAERAAALVERIENPRPGRGNRGRGGDDGPGGDRRGGGLFGNPMAGIELTDEQKPKVEKILADRAAKRQELMESMRNGDMDMSEFREAMREQQESQSAELKKVLTEEQYKKYEENSRQRPGGGRRGRRGGDG